jgi:hypothetical protein
MPRVFGYLACFFLAHSESTGPAFGGDWPRFRGPNESDFNGTPAISTGCLLLRSDSALYCVSAGGS